MSINNSELKKIIVSIYSNDNNKYSAYISKQLQKPFFLELINEIMQNSSKTASEAILVLVAAVYYQYKKSDALSILEKNDKLEEFVKDNKQEILNLSVCKKVQANIIERGLPILEILDKKLQSRSICLIELGASYGLIGSCLLNPEKNLENKMKYFANDQRFPKNIQPVEYYLGIDIDPPEKEWLLACIYDKDALFRLVKYIDDIQHSQNFSLIKASAIGFSKLKDVRNLIEKDYTIVILTSFMLYQLSATQRNSLTNEIVEFCKINKAHWINQEVGQIDGMHDFHYYIEFDGEKIIKLPDDKCGDWTWLE